MSNIDHRTGVKEASLVVRHLKLEGLIRQNQQAMVEEIDNTFGVDAVSFDERAGMLNGAYDATHYCIDGIKTIIHKHDA